MRGGQGVPHSQFPPPFPHFPPPIRFFPPPDNFFLIQELKRIYVSEELRLVHHRLSCRIFLQNYQVGKEPDYLQMNVFSRANKGNIIYTRQNNKPLVYGHFGDNSILSLVYFLDFLKDFCFTFFIQKVL